MVLNKPAGISVDVTGITGDKNQPSRIVNFDWQYNNLPPLSRRIAVKGGQGRAAFRLFDDGWRVANLISITVSETPYPLSQREEQEIAKDIASERNLQATAQQEAETAKRAFDARVRIASTSTKVLGRYTFERGSIYGGQLKVHVSVTSFIDC